MPFETAIDRAGRLVIPKALREKLGLSPGTRVHLSEHEGRLVLSPERPEPQLVEHDGFLVVDLAGQPPIQLDPSLGRVQRTEELVRAAMRR